MHALGHGDEEDEDDEDGLGEDEEEEEEEEGGGGAEGGGGGGGLGEDGEDAGLLDGSHDMEVRGGARCVWLVGAGSLVGWLIGSLRWGAGRASPRLARAQLHPTSHTHACTHTPPPPTPLRTSTMRRWRTWQRMTMLTWTVSALTFL